MSRAGNRLNRGGREFVKNLAWLLGVFGLLGAILVFATQLPLLGVAAFVGIFASVMAAIATGVVLWSGAPDETPLGGHTQAGVPPKVVVLRAGTLGAVGMGRRRRQWRLGG